jgi:LysR family glycine cleavage system transcriptional activator
MESPIRLPSIDGLRAFDAAARLGSFERAAEFLHITASAVSKRVATVEDLLGTPLFSRSGKSLGLTAAGKEYLTQVSAALELLAAVPLHQRAAQRKQRLRVNVPPTFARQILVPNLGQFTSSHPDVELEVVLSIPYLDTHGSEADVEVRHGTGSQGIVLMQDAVLPVASPALLARSGHPRKPADLACLPLLRTPLEPWTPWFRAAGLDWPEPAQGPKLVDLGLTLEAAVSGQGVALARPSLARSWLANGSLQALFALTAEPAHQYHLLQHVAEGAPQLFGHWLQGLCESWAREALHEALAQVSGSA